eukprot:7652428-Alexandrium_andersonii.AAC.1
MLNARGRLNTQAIPYYAVPESLGRPPCTVERLAESSGIFCSVFQALVPRHAAVVVALVEIM